MMSTSSVVQQCSEYTDRPDIVLQRLCSWCSDTPDVMF